MKPASSPPSTPLSLVVLLGLLVALPALGTDMFVPALPVLALSLGAEVAAAQLTLTLYFVGVAAGQIVWGPLSDRYGRKPILFAGLGIVLAMSIAAAIAESVLAVAAARLAQGLGMASGALLGRTIVRDLYAHEHAAKLLSSISIVFSIVPIAAPLTGALLVNTAGWPAVFTTHAAVALLLLVAIVPLRETAPAERRSVNPGDVARTFREILSDRRFVSPYLVLLCAQVGILAWVTNSAFTLVRGLDVSTAAYGVMFAAVMLGQILGAWSSSRLVMRLGIPRMLRVGAGVMFGAGAAAAALAWLGVSHWLAVVVPFFVFLYGTALVAPSATAAAMSPFPGSAGAAASLIGAIGFTAGALVSTLLAAVFDGSARPMATVAAVAGLAALLFERGLLRGK